MTHPVFKDRRDAGRQLAEAVKSCAFVDPVILALPRGGVPVAFEVAQALHAPLDLLLVRKIGAPHHEEYGIGAIVDGAPPQVVIDRARATAAGANQEYIDFEIAHQLAELARRRTLYGSGGAVPLKGRTAIVVDDGIATGGTVRAALQGLANSGASMVVLAVPVAPADTLGQLEQYCDRTICLASPVQFHAVGMHYRDFTQTEDNEVLDLLAKARDWQNAGQDSGGIASDTPPDNGQDW